MPSTASTLEQRCIDKNIKMTGQRRVIAQVIEESDDHPDVEEVYARSSQKDSKISIATVYRTVKLLEENGLIEKHDFGEGKARYESIPDEHHDHLIDIRSGKVVEFYNEEIERLQEQIAENLGYKIVDHRLELYCVPIDDAAK
ncbi:MAG: transcriptional repressor [Rickettsiales bacterium]|nr:transcriptional repressor [Rickettsiales bacterium]